MLVYRVAKCTYIDDLSGMGASLFAGRWNSKGIFMLYASLTPSLALLENRVHMTVLPTEEFCLAKLSIPDDKVFAIEAVDLPVDWYKYPAPSVLKKIGDAFIRDMVYLALKIPSAVLPEEYNVLINPNHPDAVKIKQVSKRPIPIDERLFVRE